MPKVNTGGKRGRGSPPDWDSLKIPAVDWKGGYDVAVREFQYEWNVKDLVDRINDLEKVQPVLRKDHDNNDFWTINVNPSGLGYGNTLEDKIDHVFKLYDPKDKGIWRRSAWDKHRDWVDKDPSRAGTKEAALKLKSLVLADARKAERAAYKALKTNTSREYWQGVRSRGG